MPKATKRERQRQNKEARRAAMQEAEKRRKRNRTIRNLALLLAPLVVIFVILQLTNGDDSDSTSSNSDGIERNYENPPENTLDPTATYTATMDTSEGTIVIALDAAQYPTSVNNFVFLARNKFYDGLLVNRVAQDFVFQTGSPQNSQAGGPGYTVVGETPTSTPAYPVGAVAFGKGGTSPAGTAGSQFFVVTGSANPDLPADYAGIGTVTEGLDVAQKIAQLYPASGDGPPTKKVTIKKITISETPAATTTTAPATTAAP